MVGVYCGDARSLLDSRPEVSVCLATGPGQGDCPSLLEIAVWFFVGLCCGDGAAIFCGEVVSIHWPVHHFLDVNMKLVCGGYSQCQAAGFNRFDPVIAEPIMCSLLICCCVRCSRCWDMLSAVMLADALDTMLLLLWGSAVLLMRSGGEGGC
ncbi:hypothetical protein Nepgr_010424 [Nepenthes gracilis]|uniref:Uncharacterized protein n=1 Tax=Nepenthes gracilis TaxID=150966 RepID=A0AAD3SDB4_NEPGR|nr:hypothetical protein Nepgr_010424 [Nepenthes gracilis]